MTARVIILSLIAALQATGCKTIQDPLDSDINAAFGGSAGIWPGGIVYYDFDSSLSAGARATINTAIAHWTANSNIQFQAAASNTVNYIHFNQINGLCNSQIGMVGGRQLLQCDLSPNSGFNSLSVVHELGHAVGLVHEQSRPDRDAYVSINWSNIPNQFRGDYDIDPSIKVASGYDFYSIMHYASFAGSNVNNSNAPVLKRRNGLAVAWNVTGLSPGDIQAVWARYGGAGMAPGVQKWLNTNRPALLIGDVRGNVGYLYAVFDADQVVPMDAGDRQVTPLGFAYWDQCAQGWVNVGKDPDKDGFWACGRSDLIGTGKEFFLGDTTGNVGNYYRLALRNGAVPVKLGTRGWNDCDSGKTVGVDITPEGFWVCSTGASQARRLISSGRGRQFRINALDGAKHGANLIIHEDCGSTNPDCLWIVKDNGMIVSARDPNLAINAWEGAKFGAELRLHNHCTPDNLDCVWKLQPNGLLVSARDPRLAVNAWLGAKQGALLKLHNGCAADNPDCIWIESAP